MMELSNQLIKQLETPCIVIDMQQAGRNIRKMQDTADKYHCSLRPHIKTHKSIEIAKMQLEAGACGITCAKVSEAEVMADAGIDDIFIAYPLVGENKLKRAYSLYKKTKRLILAVDSVECAEALSKSALKENAVFEVRLEVDTGAKRTGIMADKLMSCAKEIIKMKGIHVTGIYTFKSLIYQGMPTTDDELAGFEEGKLLAEAAGKLNLLGFDIKEISAGSTPTGEACAKTGLVTEIRPGTYVFYDQMTFIEEACKYNEIAACIYTTVVSTPTPSFAVIDAGAKTLSGDVRLNAAPFFYQGFAYVPDNDFLILDRMNEEHGIIRSVNGETKLSVGDIIKIIPTHICTAVNLQDYLYAYNDNEQIDRLHRLKVDARG